MTRIQLEFSREKQLVCFFMSTPPPLPRAKTLADEPGIRFLLPVGRSGWAIAAGYAGLLALVVVPAPLALLLAFIALADIRKSKRAGRPKHGMGRVIFAFITGGLGTLLVAFWIVAAVAGK